MIISVGIDLVELERFEKSQDRGGDKFNARLFTPGELEIAAGLGRQGEFLAGRFAAKEAVLKCLGTGWGEGVGWCDVEILRAKNGRPLLELHGKAREIAGELGATHWHVSITHTGSNAAAVAIFEG